MTLMSSIVGRTLFREILQVKMGEGFPTLLAQTRIWEPLWRHITEESDGLFKCDSQNTFSYPASLRRRIFLLKPSAKADNGKVQEEERSREVSQ